MDFRKIKKLRTSLGMTQANFAKEIDVSEKTVANLESGRQTNPSESTIEIIKGHFFKNEPEKFESFFMEWDFSMENQILDEAYTRGEIGSFYVAPLRKLFHEDDSGAVSYLISSLLGSYRATGYTDGVDAFLGEMAFMMQTSTLVENSAEREVLFNDLVAQMSRYGYSERLPIQNRDDALCAAKNIQTAHLNNDQPGLLRALRECFFFLYRNVSILYDDCQFFDAVSDISIVMGKSEYGVDARRHLFYTALNCAVALTAKNKPKGGEKE